jgi:hypothetical protein
MTREDVLAKEASEPDRSGTRETRSSYAPGMVDAVLDAPNLVADAELVPLTALAEQVTE